MRIITEFNKVNMRVNSQNYKRSNKGTMNQARYPEATAPAIARPSAADFPRPRAASKATVLRKVLSRIASRKVMTAFPCSDKKILSHFHRTLYKALVFISRKNKIKGTHFQLLPDPAYNTC